MKRPYGDGYQEENDINTAKNLLDFRNSFSSEPKKSFASQQNSYQDESQVSIIKLYEPKFLLISETYINDTERVLDTSKHLMALCLDHLISFCYWTRANNQKSEFIRGLLEFNSDLRPEVRNGLAMIFVYSLSAAKAKKSNKLDFFVALQDQDTGLGIVNKTSLKVYNDPFNYFNFLKACISGLIDSGRLPENERQNQPKKIKKMMENREEIASYLQIITILTNLLNNDENTLCQTYIQRILSIWQNRAKNIRANRFVVALRAITQMSNPARTLAACPNFTESTPDPDMMPALLWSYSFSNDSFKSPVCEISGTVPPPTYPSTESPPLSSGVLLALRFERVGLREWETRQCRIYDIDSFLQKSDSLMLLDERRFSSAEASQRQLISAGEVVELQAELEQRGLCVACWGAEDLPQLRALLQHWREGAWPQTLLEHWRRGSGRPAPSKHTVGQREDSSEDDQPGLPGHGCLAYEVVVQLGFVVRAGDAMGLAEDCWRRLYPRELLAEVSGSFAAFLATVFPQTKKCLTDSSLFAHTIVKYRVHRTAATSGVPPRLPSDTYQTIGTLQDHAADVINRLPNIKDSSFFYDFIFSRS